MLQGIPVSSGIGLGRVMLLHDHIHNYCAAVSLPPPQERLRFRQALDTFCRNTQSQAELLRISAGEDDARILEFHMEMAADPVLLEEIEGRIDSGSCAEDALRSVCGGYIETFRSAHDELIRLRAEDIKDMCSELLRVLLGEEQDDVRQAPKGTVLVASELSPSVMAGIDKENVLAIISETGGKTSHAAILARALGVPAVFGVDGAREKLAQGAFVIVDGIRGEVISAPSESVIADYWQRRESFLMERRRAEYFKERRTLSKSGEEYMLCCNISMPCGSRQAREAGGEGVGLFRTEYLFMNRELPPGEDEQYMAYLQAAEGMEGRPVVIRTLDIGGDKEAPSLGHKSEDNPFMGLRGIRWCLYHREVFLTQLRALLRAGEEQAIRIMLPMVSTLEELREAKAMMEEAAAQLSASGVPCASKLPMGIMIETPAAGAMADILAREADFFSIGTNDLTGYIMACDRGNALVSGMYSPMQPAVLKALRHIISCGRNEGIPVCVCGEAASDEHMIPVLMGFGINEFSVSPGAVLRVRRSISQWSLEEAESLADEVVGLPTLAEVEKRLEMALEEKENG